MGGGGGVTQPKVPRCIHYSAGRGSQRSSSASRGSSLHERASYIALSGLSSLPLFFFSSPLRSAFSECNCQNVSFLPSFLLGLSIQHRLERERTFRFSRNRSNFYISTAYTEARSANWKKKPPSIKPQKKGCRHFTKVNDLQTKLVVQRKADDQYEKKPPGKKLFLILKRIGITRNPNRSNSNNAQPCILPSVLQFPTCSPLFSCLYAMLARLTAPPPPAPALKVAPLKPDLCFLRAGRATGAAELRSGFTV